MKCVKTFSWYVVMEQFWSSLFIMQDETKKENNFSILYYPASRIAISIPEMGHVG